MSSIRVSILQIQSGSDKAQNLEKIGKMMQEALSFKPDLICLPEVINYRGKIELEKDIAEKLEAGNPSFDLIKNFAANNKVAIMAGSLLEINPNDTEKPLNTAFYINAQGELIHKYSKVHLFDVNMENFRNESSTRAFGHATTDNIKTFTDNINGHEIKMAMSICYDLRFPELYRSHMAQEPAEIIFVPSAFSKHTGTAHWHTLLRARAIENTCFVIAPNQVGKSPNNFHCYGHSLAVEPWGTVIAEASSDKEEVLNLEIDFEAIKQDRKKLPLENMRLL